ncbi:MAG: CRISPR-associated helicase Cas3' [Oscillibacter sp.]|nr:CRISPR-associated helicase Cas3' [Oscillibacter sp.]
MEYYAHMDGNRTQTVKEHIEAVSQRCGEFAKAFGAEKQGAWIGLAHDIGKCSAAFQKRLQGDKRMVDHSTAGAVECLKADKYAVWAAECVAGHHSGLLDVGNYRDEEKATLWGRLSKERKGKIPNYQSPVTLLPAPPSPSCGTDALSWSFYIRMLYSCLTDADFLDTEDFMSAGSVRRDSGEPLSVLLERLMEKKVRPWLEAADSPSPSLSRRRVEIRQKRCDILRTCLEAGENPRGLYTLTVPTGGGKTTSSMAFALRHALTHGMRRVIYVIPYTSIIEQTAKTFRDIFGSENVLEHHSGAVHERISGGRTEKEDYCEDPQETRAALATENWDAPIIVTTAVQFYESMYANRPAKCRKLHNIANSVIIFDEAQTLPTPHLLPCVAAMANLVKQFQATAVLCTATQPALDGIFREYGVEPKELCPDAEALYEQFRRVTFQNAGTLDAEKLAENLRTFSQALCIVNSRRAAQEVYQKLPEEGRYHLSTLMYPAHRRAVLDEIKRRLSEGLPCRVVSTSLIEAGVDVDFPAVWREMAGLDSILQAAGRCNREGGRSAEESVVTVFEGVSRTPEILKKNIGAAREVLGNGACPDAPETVAKYFQSYLDFAGRDELDKTPVGMRIVKAFREGFEGRSLPFRTVAENFHMIDSPTRTVYIPQGDGEKLLEQLHFAGPSRSLYRKLGQYAVNVYERQYKELLDAGSVEALDDDSAVLRDETKYSEETGLSIDAGDLRFLEL